MRTSLIGSLLVVVGALAPMARAQAADGCYVAIGSGWSHEGVIVQFTGPIYDVSTYCDEVKQAYWYHNPRAGQIGPDGFPVSDSMAPLVGRGDYFQAVSDAQGRYHQDCGQLTNSGVSVFVYDGLLSDGGFYPSDRVLAQNFCSAIGASLSLKTPRVPRSRKYLGHSQRTRSGCGMSIAMPLCREPTRACR